MRSVICVDFGEIYYFHKKIEKLEYYDCGYGIDEKDLVRIFEFKNLVDIIIRGCNDFYYNDLFSVIFEMSWLIKLDMKTVTICCSLKKLVNLEEFSCEEMLDEFELLNLPKLKKLDYYVNDVNFSIISNLNLEVFKGIIFCDLLPFNLNIKNLAIITNKVNIIREIEKYVNLELLIFKCPDYFKISHTDFSTLINLKFLIINGNYLDVLPNLQKLENLIIEGEINTDKFKYLLDLPNLKFLTINNQNNKTIFEIIEKIDLSELNIDTLSADNLVYLKNISLSNCNILDDNLNLLDFFKNHQGSVLLNSIKALTLDLRNTYDLDDILIIPKLTSLTVKTNQKGIQKICNFAHKFIYLQLHFDNPSLINIISNTEFPYLTNLELYTQQDIASNLPNTIKCPNLTSLHINNKKILP